MAAVLALILLPLVMALGSVISIASSGAGVPIAEIITALTVVAMGGGAFYGLLHMIHTLEGPEHDKHAH